MKKKSGRRRHSAAFKSMVAMEAMKGVRTINEIAREHNIHPVQVSEWKKQLAERLHEVFERPGGDTREQDAEKEKARLHAKIGQLAVEVDWLKKKCVQLGLDIEGD